MDNAKFRELFNEAVEKTIAQGEPSVRTDPHGAGPDCLYRSPIGLKCAIGQLIPDDSYLPTMDGYEDNGVAWSPTSILMHLGYNPTNEQAAAFSDLQYAHDVADKFDFVNDFKTHVAALQDKYRSLFNG